MQNNILWLFAVLFLGNMSLFAQTELRRIQIPYNYVQAREAAREQADLAKAREIFSENKLPLKSSAECPLFEPGSYYLTNEAPGSRKLIALIDTSGLQEPTLEIPPGCEGNVAGSAELVGDTLFFWPSPFIDAAFDTICVVRCDAAQNCDTLTYPLVVRRPGIRLTEPAIELEAEETLLQYCLSAIGLPGEVVCSYFADCPDQYAGEGQQEYWFTDTDCIGYRAARFAGTDTVCMVLCDEYAVCDTFDLPFIIRGDTLSLPFFDDFSYAGPYPDKNYWLDKSAFVNNTLAKNPPSVGMATLDGLDAGGRPYVLSGRADVLTSNYIDLSAPQGDVYLKFYLAPKGYGLLPNPQDSFLVQFRNQAGEWKTVTAVPGIDVPVDSVPPFSFYAIPVISGQYLYRGFQFRFISFTSPGGVYDLWHVDYVWLGDQSGPDAIFEDLAFTATPPPLLKKYTAMPLRQFRDFVAEELNTAPMPSRFYNHFDNTATITGSAIQVRELLTGLNFPGMENVVDGLDANIPPAEHTFRQKELAASTWADYQAMLADNFDDEERIRIETSYQFTLGAQAAPFYRNDTVRSITRLENIYAYDDGTAEGYVAFSNPQEDNPLLAVRFRTHLEDTLHAVQFHFPHVNGNAESQLFNLKVWIGELEGAPAYEANFIRPKYADTYYDTLQGFSTYLLKDYITDELTPLYIPADTNFYIAFQQVSITNQGVPIGMDFSRDRSSEYFVKLSSSWDPFPSYLSGSLMVRAVMAGGEVPFSTAVKEEKQPASNAVQFEVYPNPAQSGGEVILLSPNTTLPGAVSYRLMDFAGRNLASGRLAKVGEGQYRLRLPLLPQGLYFIEVSNGKSRILLKLVI